MRLVSGYLSDRTGSYWPITIVGYVINLLAVPLLALTGRWELAVFLIVAERAGRGIRVPARDAMLSHAGSQTGLGWGFGLHGALDSAGAILGPLTVGASLYLKGDYQGAFAILAIPAVITMMLLFAARHFYPRPRDLDVAPPDLTAGHLPRRFWIYAAAAALIAAGYADFPLIAFHFGRDRFDRAGFYPRSLFARHGGRRDGRSPSRPPVRPDWHRRDAPCHLRLGAQRPPRLPWRTGRGDDRHGVVGHRHGRPGIGDARGNRATRACFATGAPPMAFSTPPTASPGSPGAACSACFTTGPCRRSPLSLSCYKSPRWRSFGGFYCHRQSGQQPAGHEGKCRRCSIFG